MSQMKAGITYTRVGMGLLYGAIAVAALITSAGLGLVVTGCNPNALTGTKASTQLITHVQLRQAQVASPSIERLTQMQTAGMQTDNLPMQRIFIYMINFPTPAQLAELQALGVNCYPDSWIPPVANNPVGFLLADMPVDKLDALASKDYVVKLDTAERQLKPQVRPGG